MLACFAALAVEGSLTSGPSSSGRCPGRQEAIGNKSRLGKTIYPRASLLAVTVGTVVFVTGVSGGLPVTHAEDTSGSSGNGPSSTSTQTLGGVDKLFPRRLCVTGTDRLGSNSPVAGLSVKGPPLELAWVVAVP
jgi:hypothetical protein